MFRKLCGDAALKNVVLVTNMWSEVPPEVGEAREKELSNTFFKPILDLGAQMTRHQNTVQSAHDIIRRITPNHPVALQIQRELVDEHKNITDTAAGEAINRELHDQIRRHQAELEEVREEMIQALKEKDEETSRELEEETRRLQEQMEKVKRGSEGMTSNYAAEKERVEAKMKEMDQQAKGREQAEAEYHRQPTESNHSPQDAVNACAAATPRLEQEIGRPRDRLGNVNSENNRWVVIPIYE